MNDCEICGNKPAWGVDGYFMFCEECEGLYYKEELDRNGLIYVVRRLLTVLKGQDNGR